MWSNVEDVMSCGEVHTHCRTETSVAAVKSGGSIFEANWSMYLAKVGAARDGAGQASAYEVTRYRWELTPEKASQ